MVRTDKSSLDGGAVHGAELAQRLDKGPTETLTRKEPAAAIGAGSDKLQLAGLKMASIDRHKRKIGGHGRLRESQSWARSAPAGPRL